MPRDSISYETKRHAFLPRNHELVLPVKVVRGLIFSPDLEAILLGQRISGLWELPGGKQNIGESDKQTCAREILEETGITVDQNMMTNPREHTHYPFKKDAVGREYRGIAVSSIMRRGLCKPQTCELKDVKWFDLSKAVYTIENESMNFRHDTTAALQAITPDIIDCYGVSLQHQVERITQVIAQHEVQRSEQYATDL